MLSSEIIFIVEVDDEGGYFAHVWGVSIFTESDTLEELYGLICDAVRCHFYEEDLPKIIRYAENMVSCF